MAILDLQNSAVDRVRVAVSDTAEIPYLNDDTIQFYIDKNNGNERKAVIECGLVILGILSRGASYSKVNEIIFDGKNSAKAYKDFLLMITNPRYSGDVMGGYAGGISISDMEANEADTDNNLRPNLEVEQNKTLLSF